MASGSVTVPPGEAAAPLNFIYACSICCYTLADVYEGQNETVQGLSDGINPKDRLVTHLYLASCCHVFCGSHLEGGAPQFHPEGQRPKAPCPTCLREKKDGEPRDLYSIRGFHKTEHDPMIPPAWFVAPPMSFDGNGKEIEALRFQYLALIRYCQNTHAMRKPLQDALTTAENKLQAMQDLASKEHAKVLTLQQEKEKLQAVQQMNENLKPELERLRGVDQEVEQYRRLDVNPKDLETFKNNKDAIRHYLKLVPTLIEQNDKMRSRLASLGFAMALEPVPNLKGFDLDALNDDGGMNGNYHDTPGASMRKTSSSHTAGRSAHTSGNAKTAPSSPFMHRPLKRQRIDSPLPKNMQVELPTSRDAMPPPKKPLSRIRSVRKIFPTLRNKFSSGRSTQASDYNNRSGDDLQMYEYGQWEDERGSTAREDSHDGTPYMSGALPVEPPSQGSNPCASQLLSSGGIDNNGPDFKFRTTSPVKISKSSSRQSSQLPTEPSYIRLMDGLSQDNGIELGLKDPRGQNLNTYQALEEYRQVIPYGQDARSYREVNLKEHRPREQAPQYRSTRGPSLPAGSHCESAQTIRTNRYYDRTSQESTHHPVTPAPRRYQQPDHQIESVVSPYVERYDRNLSYFARPWIAETQDSSNHFAGYRLQKPRIVEPQTSWREPRGLNGLSFFDSPVISKDQPYRNSHEPQQTCRPPSIRHYQSRNLNSSGFITRPDIGHSPFFRDSAYGSSRPQPTYPTQQHMYSKSAVPSPSFSRSSHSRTGHVPSTMPSTVTGRSPVRTQPQWEGLQRTGVRSSRHELSKNPHAGPGRNLLSSVGRPSIRR